MEFPELGQGAFRTAYDLGDGTGMFTTGPRVIDFAL
jgi:hypothetical protein